MGLFSWVGKALGGVGKLAGGVLLGAANQATGGIAGKALNAVKGLVGGKPKAATVAANEDQPATAKQIAMLNKLSPKVIRTESGSSRSEGWGFGPGRKQAAKRKPHRSAPAAASGRPVVRQTSQKPARATKSKKAGRGGLRPGMLDLAAMARAWKAAGRPGSWQMWIKTNPLRV